MNSPDNPVPIDEVMRCKIALGSCAWSFEDWRGSFYPESLPQAQRLAAYAHCFNAVDVDSTFYHPPTQRIASHWAAATPKDFTFSLKLSRVITHDRHLRDCQPLVRDFLVALEPLRSKIGSILVQLPAAFKPSRDEDALRAFLASLPRDWDFAVEFRDPAWHAPRIVHRLQEHRVCWVWPDTESLEHQADGAFEWLPQTTDYLYIRLLGDQKTRYTMDGSHAYRYDRMLWARDRSLQNWAVKVRHHLGESRRVYLYVNNHFEGNAPRTCQRLANILGWTLDLPQVEPLKPPEPDAQLSLL